MKQHTVETSVFPLLKFALPSLLGIFLFMLPIPYQNDITIPIAILSNELQTLLSNSITYVILILSLISSVGALLTKLFSPKFILNNSFLNSLFNISWIWCSLRCLASIFIVFIYAIELGFKVPESLTFLQTLIVSTDTGLQVLDGLLPVLFCVFLFAGLFLPLLLNFGLLEFIGCLFTKVMRPIFGLPGRSAIDCIASWLGDGTIGVLLTSKQYEDSFYTEREACVIGTTFSLVSITFSLVVINTVGLGHLFVPFYFTVTIASLVAAIIMPKLPPLSLKKNTLYNGQSPKQEEELTHKNSFQKGLALAKEKAKSQNILRTIFIDGTKNVIDMWIGVIPIVMAVGTIALVLATYTPLFKILGLPFAPVLSILNIPEAAAASETLVAGFADMLLPAVLASNIESDLTRFVVASVSVTQLVYLSEVGALLLSSKIPVKLWELFIIFIERTLITLPIIALMAHLFL